MLVTDPSGACACAWSVVPYNYPWWSSSPRFAAIRENSTHSGVVRVLLRRSASDVATVSFMITRSSVESNETCQDREYSGVEGADTPLDASLERPDTGRCLGAAGGPGSADSILTKFYSAHAVHVARSGRLQADGLFSQLLANSALCTPSPLSWSL